MPGCTLVVVGAEEEVVVEGVRMAVAGSRTEAAVGWPKQATIDSTSVANLQAAATAARRAAAAPIPAKVGD